MRIHHLNCGSMVEITPEDGPDSPLRPAPAVCHCLLIETDRDGLVLVETGLGRQDIERPVDSLGETFLARARPVLDPAETAYQQVIALGHRPDEVRHIVLTHLDGDHSGGLPDFPAATVHLMAAEHQAALAGTTDHPEHTERYRDAHWAHRPHWTTYEPARGEPWFGFDAVRQLTGLPPEILLVPLGGHTAGHAAVAVADGDRWLLHAGDHYYYHGELDQPPHSILPAVALQEIAEVDRALRLGNQARLRELVSQHGDQVEVFCAHDPWELARAQARAN